MATTDLSDWLVAMEAAMRIGCSTRTIERLGRAKKLEQRLRRQEGTPPVAVYNPDDVARIAAERHPAPPPFVLRAEVDRPANGNGHTSDVSNPHTRGVLARQTSGEALLQAFIAALDRLAQSPPSPPVAEKVAETSANPFLTLAEAAAFRHVSERLVLKWMRTEKLDFEREPRSQWTAEDRGWRIRRKDLEAL